MPFDAMLVSAAIVVVFVVFALVLLWGDRQTRSDRLETGSHGSKRRSF